MKKSAMAPNIFLKYITMAPNSFHKIVILFLRLINNQNRMRFHDRLTEYSLLLRLAELY